MIALGEHVIVRRPPKQEKTAGGIIVEQTDQKRMHGKIVSVGDEAWRHMQTTEGLGPDEPPRALVGAYMIFDPAGEIALEVDPLKKADLVAFNYSNCIALLTDEDVERLALPKVE